MHVDIIERLTRLVSCCYKSHCLLFHLHDALDIQTTVYVHVHTKSYYTNSKKEN